MKQEATDFSPVYNRRILAGAAAGGTTDIWCLAEDLDLPDPRDTRFMAVKIAAQSAVGRSAPIVGLSRSVAAVPARCRVLVRATEQQQQQQQPESKLQVLSAAPSAAPSCCPLLFFLSYNSPGC